MGQTAPTAILGAPEGTVAPPAAAPFRYCLYARKSTESDERQALSIDSQINEMTALAQREGLNVVEIKRESYSAKASGNRPVFNQLIAGIREHKFDAILTWAPDRLSRNAGDLGSLVDLMDQKVLMQIRTFGQTFINAPDSKFLLMILCSQAKLENDNKSINVKRGLKAKCEMGLRPGQPPTGYLNETRIDRRGHALVDPVRAPYIKKMFEHVANDQWSGRQIYRWLIDEDFTTRTGKRLRLGNIYMLLRNPFYYGAFEYPTNSGNWYTGKHEPLITKELFEQVQTQLNRDNIERHDCKEFAFTKLMKCGLCGSGITADEKFKKLSDGSVRRYVYYGCTRARNINCKSGYLREEELIKQLMGVIDTVSLDELGIRKKFEAEMGRYYKFSRGFMEVEAKPDIKQEEADMRKYARYVLQEGSVVEKRELLGNLKSQLLLKNKKIYLMK